MKHRFILLLVALLIIHVGCSKKTEHATDQSSNNTDHSTYTSIESEGDESDDNEVEYPDGRYCARVEYYYSETGTNSTYTLAIDIEDGEVGRIHWPNGGWLDNSHFSSADISDGTARFSSFEGVDYEVTVVGRDGDCSLSISAVDEDQMVEEAKTAKEQSWQDMVNEQNRVEQEQLRIEEEEEEQREAEEQEEEPNT